MALWMRQSPSSTRSSIRFVSSQLKNVTLVRQLLAETFYFFLSLNTELTLNRLLPVVARMLVEHSLFSILFQWQPFFTPFFPRKINLSFSEMILHRRRKTYWAQYSMNGLIYNRTGDYRTRWFLQYLRIPWNNDKIPLYLTEAQAKGQIILS